jgi:carbon starvation protein CstA
MVDRVCQACTDDIKKKSDEAQAAYDAIPVRMSYALITAAVLAVVGAAIWAASIIATQTMYWMIAILIGAGIGWATTKAAGKGARSVQVIVFTATVLSILVGMIFFIGYIVQAEAVKAGQTVNWIGLYCQYTCNSNGKPVGRCVLARRRNCRGDDRCFESGQTGSDRKGRQIKYRG